jgi:Fe-S-cluster containining protein
LLALEDALPEILVKATVSKKGKLKRIYIAMDKISKIREPFVACGIGCSDCCRMNISVSKLEAQTISGVTGKQFVDLQESMSHKYKHFVGTACPFLEKDECSIYDHRPLVCRRHSSFHSTAEWCTPDVLLEKRVPIIQFGGIDRAFIETSSDNRGVVIADIRDFFPTLE